MRRLIQILNMKKQKPLIHLIKFISSTDWNEETEKRIDFFTTFSFTSRQLKTEFDVFHHVNFNWTLALIRSLFLENLKDLSLWTYSGSRNLLQKKHYTDNTKRFFMNESDLKRKRNWTTEKVKGISQLSLGLITP